MIGDISTVDLDDLAASRLSNSTNDAIVISKSCLNFGDTFYFKLEQLNTNCVGSLEYGIVVSDFCAEKTLKSFPSLAKIYARDLDVLSDTEVLINNYFPTSLDQMEEGSKLGVILNPDNTVSFIFNDVTLSSIYLPERNLNEKIFAFCNLYGRALKIKMLDYGNEICLDDSPNDKEEEQTTNEFCLPKHSDIDFDRIQIGDSLELCSKSCSISRTSSSGSNMVVFAEDCAKRFPVLIRVNRLDEDSYSKGGLGLGVQSIDSGHVFSAFLEPNGIFLNQRKQYSNCLQLQKFLQNFNNLEVGRYVECILYDRVMKLKLGQGVSMQYELPLPFSSENARLVLDLSYEVREISLLSTSTTSMYVPEEMNPLAFHAIHGRNCSVDESKLSAHRPDASSEFSDAILMSNRRLADNELFEVRIDSLLDLWSGSIEIGLTMQDPEKIVFPRTMTEMTKDIWMISGSAVVHNGDTIWNNYTCDFDQMSEGCTVGVMRSQDGAMHVFLNGKDMGVACVGVPAGVYAIVDLYGQCNKVTIVHPNRGQFDTNDLTLYLHNPASDYQHSFFYGDDFSFNSNNSLACVKKDHPRSKSSGFLLFSSSTIKALGIFTVKLKMKEHAKSNATFKIGLTNFNPNFCNIGFKELAKDWFTCYWTQDCVYLNGSLLNASYSPSLETILVPNSELSLVFTDHKRLSFAWNDYIFPELSNDVDENCFVFIDVEDSSVSSIECTSTSPRKLSSKPIIKKTRTGTDRKSKADNQSLENCAESNCFLSFPKGNNLDLCTDGSTCKRYHGQNNALAITRGPLETGKVIMLLIQEVDLRLKATMALGVIEASEIPNKSKLTLDDVKNVAHFVTVTGVFNRGTFSSKEIVLQESWLKQDNKIGILFDAKGDVNLVVGAICIGVIAKDVKSPCHLIVDVSGSVTEIRFLNEAVEIEKLEVGSSVMDTENSKDVGKSFSTVGCKYSAQCESFLKLLKLPSLFFAQDDKRRCCFCESCSKHLATETCFKQGEPLKPFTLPIGWCKFNLNLPTPKTIKLDKSTWHVAYHCPNPVQLRKVLDSAGLFLPLPDSNIQSSISNHGGEKLREKFENMILMSPTVNYCSQPVFCNSMKFSGGHEGETLSAKVALQVWVKPDSYASSAPSIDPGKSFDDEIPLAEHEWTTKEKNSTFVSALLIKIERL